MTTVPNKINKAEKMRDRRGIISRLQDINKTHCVYVSIVTITSGGMLAWRLLSHPISCSGTRIARVSELVWTKQLHQNKPASCYWLESVIWVHLQQYQSCSWYFIFKYIISLFPEIQFVSTLSWLLCEHKLNQSSHIVTILYQFLPEPECNIYVKHP